MDALTPALVRAEWQKESAFLYPPHDGSSVAARSVAGVEALLASDPDGCLQGVRGYQHHFPDVVRLLRCDWCFDPSAYSNAVEVEFQSRLLGMAAGQVVVARHARELARENIFAPPVDPSRFEGELAQRFGNLVVRVPGTLRPDLMSPRVLGQGRIGFVVVPVYYHQACEDFAQQLREGAHGLPGYADDPLGTMMTAMIAGPQAPPARVALELVAAVVASLAGNVDRVAAADFGAAVQGFSALFGEAEERDELVNLLPVTLTDFAMAHEAGHWWAQHRHTGEPSHAAAQEAAAHTSALSMLVAYHHVFRDTGLFDAMLRANLSPVVAPLLIQVLHVCFLRYLFALTVAIMLKIGAATADERLKARLARLADAHRQDLLHFQWAAENVKRLVYADAASFSDDMHATVDADVLRVLQFQRAVFERFDREGAVLGPISDEQLLLVYRSFQRVMPPAGVA